MSYIEEFWDKHRKQKKLTPEQEHKAREKDLEEQRQRIIAYKRFFGTEHGQQVMLDLMNQFGILKPTPETDSPIAIARVEGKRDVVLYLLKLANVDLDRLDKLMKGEFI